MDSGGDIAGLAGTLLCWCFCGAISLVPLAFWIWMIVDCAQNEPSEGNDKIVWLLVIIFANWIGALIYFFARRPKRIAMFGK